MKTASIVRVGVGSDDTFPGWTGRLVIVERIEFKSARVGETALDPFYICRRSDGKRDGFWREELVQP